MNLTNKNFFVGEQGSFFSKLMRRFAITVKSLKPSCNCGDMIISKVM